MSDLLEFPAHTKSYKIVWDWLYKQCDLSDEILSVVELQYNITWIPNHWINNEFRHSTIKLPSELFTYIMLSTNLDEF